MSTLQLRKKRRLTAQHENEQSAAAAGNPLTETAEAGRDEDPLTDGGFDLVSVYPDELLEMLYGENVPDMRYLRASKLLEDMSAAGLWFYHKEH